MHTDTPTRLLSGTLPLSFNGLNLADIEPSRSAKYSPNLYEFLAAKRQVRSTTPRARVFADSDNTKWLGYFDSNGSFIGTRLNQVLGRGKEVEVTCPVNLGPLRELETFWTDYVRDGRCAIDVRHQTPFINADSRWKVEGDVRHCLWCNRTTQTLKKWTETVTREAWVATPDA